MFNIITALTFVLSVTEARTIVVIDTPINLRHREFIGEDIKVYNYDGPASDNDGFRNHGTGILSIIISGEKLKDRLSVKHKYLICSDYKNYNLRCYELALKTKAHVVNYSGGGVGYIKAEEELIKQLSNAGTKMFFAAGNEGRDIAKYPYYPASFATKYTNITAVENVNSSGERYPNSNYSYYSKKYLGVKVLSADYKGSYYLMTGTSPATANATHEYLKGLEK